jgi:hypothetical protein
MDVVKARLPFMLLAMINLIVGLTAGLSRIGWGINVPDIAVHHGALMVGGFLGALIALEKAIPLKKNWVLAVPVLCALTPIMTVEGYHKVGLGFLLAGSIGLVGIQAWYLIRFPRDASMFLMVVGACCLVVGNSTLIHTSFYPSAFPWWMGFLLFTIVGERLELSKFLPVPPSAKRQLNMFLLLFIVSIVLPFHGFGKYMSGIVLIVVAIWLLRYDVIRVGLRGVGLVKYSAIALLTANIALMIEGVFLLVLPNGAFAYDTLVHVFFLGFAFAMIFAHGPIILPSVLGFVARPFHPVLYVWLGLLHLSVILRVAGNASLQMDWRRIGGALSVLAILAYLITLAILVFIGAGKAATKEPA